MSWIELLVILGGLAAGYWIVSRVIGARQRTTRDRDDSSANARDGEQAGPSPRSHTVDEFDLKQIQGNWYEVLGVPPNASMETIKSAYRAKVQQYHPDKTERLGPEFRELAERKIKELNAAYNWAVKLRR